MSQERFDALLVQLCKALPRDAAADVRDRRLLSVDGHDVLIDHWPEDGCRVLVDMGLPPAGVDSGFYRRLLESNVDAELATAPVLGLEPISGHIVAIVQLPLDAVEQREDGLANLIMKQLPQWMPEWKGMLTHRGSDAPVNALAWGAGWMEMRP